MDEFVGLYIFMWMATPIAAFTHDRVYNAPDSKARPAKAVEGALTGAFISGLLMLLLSGGDVANSYFLGCLTASFLSVGAAYQGAKLTITLTKANAAHITGILAGLTSFLVMYCWPFY